MESKTSNKTIVKNATLLYVRMFVSMAIGFYTSRVVLQALGVEDFGLFNILAGIVTLMCSLNASFSNASSRFLSYNMNDKNLLHKTFTNAFLMHLIVAVVVLLLGETIGLWFVNTQLVIVPDRMFAANCVYQATLISTVLDITQIPYNASIMSHEKMNVFAFVEILNSTLKLAIALCVLYLPFKDSLIQYGFLYTLVSFTIILTYRIYCVRNFEECRITWKIDKTLIRQMIGFIGWNFFSELSFTFRQQGLNIILNRAFGTMINAASGIALQVQAVLYGFIGNISTAFRPQIIKSYANKEYNRCNNLVLTGAKCVSFFIIIISIPVFVNLDFLMALWLGDVPEGAVILGKICIVQNIINSFNYMPGTIVVATGKMRVISILRGMINLSCIIVAYLALEVTNLYYIVYSISALFSLFLCILNVYIAKRQFVEFECFKYLTRIVLPITIITILSCFIVNYVYDSLSNDIIKLFITSVLSTVIITIFTYTFLLDAAERDFVLKKLKR